VSLIKSVVVGGEISVASSPDTGQNASFSFSFMGPQVSCQNTTTRNTIPILSNQANSGDADLGTAFWMQPWFKGGNRKTSFSMDKAIIGRDYVFGTVCFDPTGNCSADQVHAWATAKSILNCMPRNAKYSANISWINGLQNLTYKIDKIENLTVETSMIADSTLENNQEGGYKVRGANVPLEIQIMNSYAILETFMMTVGFLKRMTCKIIDNPLESEWKLPNGTMVPLNDVSCTLKKTDELDWAMGKRDSRRL
jgi:hypothetical protein